MSNQVAAPINMAALVAAATTPLSATPKNIVNGYSTSGYAVGAGFAAPAGVAKLLSGVMVANVLKPLLNINGGGVLNFIALTTRNATSRTLRMQLVLDGVIVFDSTSAAITGADMGAFIVGFLESSNAVSFDAIPFKTSCVLNVASSLTETDMLNVMLQYRTN